MDSAMGSLSQFLSTGIISDLLCKQQIITSCCPKAYSLAFADAMYQDPHAINIFLQIKNRCKGKIIRVLYYDGFDPVCYPDPKVVASSPNRIPLGLDPDILKMFAKIAECTLTWTRANKFDGISNFDTNQYDIAIGGIANTQERLTKIKETKSPIEWTMPYYYVKRSFLIRKDGVKQDWLAVNSNPETDIVPAEVQWTNLEPADPQNFKILRIMFATYNSTGWKDATDIARKVIIGRFTPGKFDTFFILMPGFKNEAFELELLKENKIMDKQDFILRVQNAGGLPGSREYINHTIETNKLFIACKSIKVVGIMRGNDVCKSLAAKLNKETQSNDYTYRTWEYTKKEELSADGEVFAYPVSIESNICAALSSFIGYLITCGKLDELMDQYKM